MINKVEHDFPSTICAILEFLNELGCNYEFRKVYRSFRINNNENMECYVHFGDLSNGIFTLRRTKFMGVYTGSEKAHYFAIDDPEMFDKLKHTINEYTFGKIA